MRLRMRRFALPPVLLLPALAWTSPSLASPLFTLLKADRQLNPQGTILFEGEKSLLLKSPEASADAFDDLYWLSLEDARYDRLSLEALAPVEAYVDGEYAVLRIPADDLVHVAHALHDTRWSCGQLLKLDGDAPVSGLRAANAQALRPVSQALAEVPALHKLVQPARIRSEVEAMVALGTRYARGTNPNAVTEQLIDTYRALAAGRSDITISGYSHSSSPNQDSLVVRIEGVSRPDEILVLGSHIDSIAPGSATAPGADDNASGTASNIEVFRAIIESGVRFDRTIEIHGYAAEELGLIGSQDIAKKYVNGGKKVVAMLQNDMNMYRSGTQDVIWLITNDTNAQLTADLETLVKGYQSVLLNKGRLTAGSSDHRAWTRQGIPAAFPTENPNGYNKKIHTAQDTIANSGYFTQSAEFSKLSLSFLAHFGGVQNPL